jgi:hypothetical protein
MLLFQKEISDPFICKYGSGIPVYEGRYPTCPKETDPEWQDIESAVAQNSHLLFEIATLPIINFPGQYIEAVKNAHV